MRAVILIALVLANFHKIEGANNGNCKIKGLSNYDWTGFTLDDPIGDTYEGLITTFETSNVVEMISYESTYMTATFSDDTLSIFTNDRFKQFEEEYEGSFWYTPSISINIKFTCTDNKIDTLSLEQEVADDNTHDPVFDKDIYEYHFGMPIPEDYDLTQFLSISATDKDFTNTEIYYTIDFSDELLVGYKGEGDYDGVIFSTKIKALKEIRAPFRKEFTIVATDGGEPPRNSIARVIVSVTSNGNDDDNQDGGGDEDNESSTHPPVFAQHLYFANYTSNNDLEMQETITIKYGAEDDTTIKQSGYDEYFKITLDPKIKGALEVINLQSLPQTIIKSTSFLVVEIEAENKDLHMPGRTALIIHLPSTNQEYSNGNCGAVEIWGFSSNNSLSLIFFLIAMFMIVVMNIIVLLWFFQKKKMATDVTVPYQTSPISDIPRLEKVRI